MTRKKKNELTDEEFIRERKQRAAMDEYFERLATTPEGQSRQKVSHLVAMALSGQNQPLIEYLEEGGEMIEVLRPIFLNLLRTVKAARKVGRPPGKQLARDLSIVDWVANRQASGWLVEAAVRETAQKYGLSDKQIYNCLDRYDDLRQSILDDARAEGLDGPP